jgi:hypothetical protein
VEGNDQPMVTTWELWYSPNFGISLLSILDSPRVGKQVFTVTEISASEPEHSLFTVPAGYSVVDRRKTEAPSDQTYDLIADPPCAVCARGHGEAGFSD